MKIDITRETLTQMEDDIEGLIFRTLKPYFPSHEDILDDIMIDLIDELMDKIVTTMNEVEK